MTEQTPTTTDHAAAVRRLVEYWALAVEREDRAGVEAAHADDVVMFDVPPPLVLRGLEEYRATWDLFYEFQKDGVFRWDELHVEADADVAYCWGLVTCGGADPATHFPVRLSIGLRRSVEHGWQVVHEHHSVPAGEPNADGATQ